MAIDTDRRIAGAIASEIGARPDQVAAAAGLLDGGATVPFVARYRKEATGGLDDVQLRTLADRLAYLRELEARREAILGSIREQGKLTPELEGADRGGRDQGGARGSLPALQAEAADQGDDRAGARAWSALAEAILADRRDAARDAGRGPICRRRGPRREGGAGRGARYPHRAAAARMRRCSGGCGPSSSATG